MHSGTWRLFETVQRDQPFATLPDVLQGHARQQIQCLGQVVRLVRADLLRGHAGTGEVGDAALALADDLHATECEHVLGLVVPAVPGSARG